MPRGIYSFHLSVSPFVCSFITFCMFVELTSKVLVKVSLSEYISLKVVSLSFECIIILLIYF